jgi:hypothetical protein
MSVFDSEVGELPSTESQEIDIDEFNVYLLRGGTHVNRGGRIMRRRLNRSLCVEFFLLIRV